MELTELKDRIISSFEGTEEDLNQVLDLVEQDQSVFPFNQYEHLICSLIEKGGFSYQKYIDIRTEYISVNPNLWIFEISAPRGFGEKFAQTYIQGKGRNIMRPNKSLDKDYNGAYDLWFDGIRIEVKASRAVDSQSDEPLYIKALSRNTTKPFIMNFQQLKPQYCDVFIWLAVFRDEIVIWIMNSNEVLNNQHYSTGQHRGNRGNEGQLHIKTSNISEFSEYELLDNNIEEVIKRAYERG